MSKHLSAKYYQENKERPKKACERWQYGLESYKNLPEDEKQKLVECRKKYYRMIKKLVTIIIFKIMT